MIDKIGSISKPIFNKNEKEFKKRVLKASVEIYEQSMEWLSACERYLAISKENCFKTLKLIQSQLKKDKQLQKQLEIDKDDDEIEIIKEIGPRASIDHGFVKAKAKTQNKMYSFEEIGPRLSINNEFVEAQVEKQNITNCLEEIDSRSPIDLGFIETQNIRHSFKRKKQNFVKIKSFILDTFFHH